ncbi:MAG: hypothetical protein AAF213_06605 [Pseudomonadota bacterium]
MTDPKTTGFHNVACHNATRHKAGRHKKSSHDTSPLSACGDEATCALCRRSFLRMGAAAAGCACAGWGLPALGQPKLPYNGPNVIIIRFGGGVRRRETIDPDHTFAPYTRHILAPQGTLFTNMQMAEEHGAVPSHGEGTLYILTGHYEEYKDIEGRFLGVRYEPKVPTLFEYLRRLYDIATDEALIINGEDRMDEEFYTFSQHHLFGLDYRAETISLFRFKRWLARQQLKENRSADEIAEIEARLAELGTVDYRKTGVAEETPRLQRFWEEWRKHFGDDGFKNPRGDRLLTELSIRALRQLRPRLMMINYQDPDYVHWGNASHYTRGITVIDQGIEEIVTAINADPFYSGRTILALVPDCGRDTNALMDVPYQHHFKSKSSFDIWGLLVGPGINRGQVVDTPVEQIDMAATIGQMMGFKTSFGDGTVLEAAL